MESRNTRNCPHIRRVYYALCGINEVFSDFWINELDPCLIKHTKIYHIRTTGTNTTDMAPVIKPIISMMGTLDINNGKLTMGHTLVDHLNNDILLTKR